MRKMLKRRYAALLSVIFVISSVGSTPGWGAPSQKSGGPNLTISMTTSPDPVVVGTDLTYSIVIKNLGPTGANAVSVIDTFPAAAYLVSSQSSQGSCTGTTTVTCSLGKLARNGTVEVTIVLRPTEGGTLSNTAKVSSDRNDADPTDNSSTVSSNVICADIDQTSGPQASGSASGARVETGSVNETVGSSQSNQSGPGSDSESSEVHSLPVASIFEAETLKTASTSEVSSGNENEARSRSTAEVSNVNLLDGLIRASYVRSSAEAYANGDSADVSADGSMITGLVVDGVPIVVDEPNMLIDLSDSKFGRESYVVLFEQTFESDDSEEQLPGNNYGDLWVNMIRVHIPDMGRLTLIDQPVDLVVGATDAHASIPRTGCKLTIYKIEGTWSEVDDPSNSLNGSIVPGEPFVGVVTLDASAKDSQTDDETVGDYWHRTRAYGIRIESGGLVFETNPEDVEFLLEVVNRALRDNYLLRSYRNVSLNSSVTVDHISWQLDDPSGTALSSDQLPDSPPDLSKWQSDFGLTIEGNESDEDSGNNYFFRGHVDSVSMLNPGT
jgi:uncharacterized repeat protein (TIGR01451 family)